MNLTDFYYINEGSIIILMPKTDEAKKWTVENIALDPWQNSFQIAIEPRYFDNIVDGILNDNLTIEKI